MAQSVSQSIAAGTTGAAIRISPSAALGTQFPSVTAIPGASGSMLVQFTTSPVGTTLVWQNWPAGTVTVTTTDSLQGAVTYVRATATTSAGVLEVCQ